MERIRELSNNQFLRHNLVYFAGTMIFGALSYLYYPILGRLMAPASFGEVQTLITIFLQYTIFLNVLDLVVINVLVSYESKQLARRVVLELEKLATIVGLLLVLLALIFSGPLKTFLQFQSRWPFALVGIAGVIAIPFIFRSGYLQSQKRFAHVTGANIVSAGGRLILGVALVILGFGTLGAMWGLVFAQLVALAFAAMAARRYGFQDTLRLHSLPNMRLMRPELTYAGLVLAGSLTVTLLYSVDVLVVKHYFDARTAGLYAGISVTARILFFLTASVAQVLIPSVSRQKPASQNQRTLLHSLGLLTALGGAALLVFYAAPELIIRILLGRTYLTYAGLLPRLSIAVFIVSLINLLVIYHTALRRYIVALIALIGSALTLGLMVLNHATLSAVVNDLIVSSACILGMLLILTITDLRLNGTKRNLLINPLSRGEGDCVEPNYLDHHPDVQ